MFIRNVFVILSIVFLFSACSVTHEYAREKLLISKVYSQDISALQYNRLPPNEPYIVDLNERSPSFNFATGKSYFISIELPTFEKKYGLRIKSFVLGQDIYKSHIFYPKALLFDKNYSVISENPQFFSNLVKASYLETAKENKWGYPLKIEGHIVIDDPKIKYMIILTTDTLLSSSTPYWVKGLGGLYTNLIEIPHSPFGRVVVMKHNEL